MDKEYCIGATAVEVIFIDIPIHVWKVDGEMGQQIVIWKENIHLCVFDLKHEAIHQFWGSQYFYHSIEVMVAKVPGEMIIRSQNQNFVEGKGELAILIHNMSDEQKMHILSLVAHHTPTMIKMEKMLFPLQPIN